MLFCTLQQNHPIIYVCICTFSFVFFTIVAYPGILNIVSCAVCWDLVIRSLYNSFASADPKLLRHPSPNPLSNHRFYRPFVPHRDSTKQHLEMSLSPPASARVAFVRGTLFWCPGVVRLLW